jgi:glycerate kinase
MRILIAPDTLKGSLSAVDAANCIEAGLHAALSTVECIKIPMSDGGEGFLATIAQVFPYMQQKTKTVTGPRGKPILARYGFIAREETAVIEWAQGAGLHGLPATEQDALTAQSTGIGELMRHAEAQGATRFIIGLGGSATCDGGIGALSQLGFHFLNKTGKTIEPNARGLLELDQIVEDKHSSFKRYPEITVLYDVNSPLTGHRGAILYAKQKGATSRECAQIKQAFTHYGHVLDNYTQQAIQHIPGTGAAGGAGAGFHALLNAKLMSGAEWILNKLDMANIIKTVDCVIVSEGSLDAQSLSGKAPIKIATLAKKEAKPVIALVGKNTLGPEQLNATGITAVFSLTNGPMSKKTALTRGQLEMQHLSEQLGRLLNAFSKQ